MFGIIQCDFGNIDRVFIVIAAEPNGFKRICALKKPFSVICYRNFNAATAKMYLFKVRKISKKVKIYFFFAIFIGDSLSISHIKRQFSKIVDFRSFYLVRAKAQRFLKCFVSNIQSVVAAVFGDYKCA